MAALSKKKLEEILTRRLRLAEPRFKLEREGSMIFGSIISPSFERKGDLERQRLIRRAVEAEFHEDAARLVGTLLAYTPYEWNIGEDIVSKR